eukprot:Gb_40170 [translate_table: standard]
MAVLISSICCCSAQGGLRVGFYSDSCADAESIVRSRVEARIQSDPTIAAALLRLHYHDCFVQGCDGSILIAGPNAERSAPTHAGLRGFDVIEDAKTQVELTCPGVVSCADIIALAARDALLLSKGPNYDVPTGRRDGVESSAADASDMPDPTDSVDLLLNKFAAKGLSASDLQRLYNFTTDGSSDPTINPELLTELKQTCPAHGNVNARLALDIGSQFDFDTNFLSNVREGNAVLESDAKLYEDTSTRAYIDSYFGLLSGILGPYFASDFVDAIVRLGQIDVKSGSGGEIRRVCSAFN